MIPAFDPQGNLPEGISGLTFLDFFQTDEETGARKGIVGIRLETFAP